MAKVSSVEVLDGSLDIKNACNEMHACAGQPTSYADIAARSLAVQAMVGGDFTKGAGSPDGRASTVAAKSGVPITSAGTADHVALRNTTTQAYHITTAPPVVLGSGVVDINSWATTQRNPT